MTPTCIALLAILQADPTAKDKYPADQRRECVIEQVELMVRDDCNASGGAWCTPSGMRERATTIVDEIIRLKASPESLSPSEERARRALMPDPPAGRRNLDRVLRLQHPEDPVH